VERNGVVKVYPIDILNWHESVNDHFRKEPIVITFCPLCGTGMAFLATVKGQPLKFDVSGLLYNSDVLLYDRDSESLWSQIITSGLIEESLADQKIKLKFNANHQTARAYDLAGNLLPSTTAFWFAWYAFHPQTELFTADYSAEK
jgi:hypothetical protein